MPNPNSIDINADVGEGLNIDAQLIPMLTSCNIACGGHAGNEASMTEAISHAKRNNVQIGAHPSFPDRENFGRFQIDISPAELFESISAQINQLSSICESLDTKLAYVKPHGALYHSLNNSYLLSLEFAELMKSEFTGLSVLGFPNMNLMHACTDIGSEFIKEGFADRGYGKNGTLLARGKSGAIIDSIEAMEKQVFNRLLISEVRSLCFHGDHKHTLTLIPELKKSLSSNHIEVKRF
jgi:UPF0271 protein